MFCRSFIFFYDLVQFPRAISSFFLYIHRNREEKGAAGGVIAVPVSGL
jgi:hypothetical protein